MSVGSWLTGKISVGSWPIWKNQLLSEKNVSWQLANCVGVGEFQLRKCQLAVG